MNNKSRIFALVLALVFIISLTSCEILKETENFIKTSNDSVSTTQPSESEVFTDVSEEEDDIPKDKYVNFLACPDNLIHPCVYYDALERAADNNGVSPTYSDLHNQEYDFSSIYKNVSEIISTADIAYINQESLIGGTSRRPYGYPCFNTQNAMGDTVADLGFDIVNVAHNHMLDSGNTDYLEHCNSYFTSKQLEVLGYYPDLASTEYITVIEKNDIKIAFLTYTYGTNGIELDSNSKFIIPTFDKNLITKQVEMAKTVADFVIVSCHWGDENTHNVNWTQNHYAEFLCELEVDVVLGMHPHCIQPMEWKTSSNGFKTLVVYSLGNFVSGMDRGINNLGCMLSLKIKKDAETGEVTLEDTVAIPFVNHYVKSEAVASDDKGYRNYEVFLLKDYSEELASIHGAHSYERSNGTTLEGGKFSLENLWATYRKYIPEEFHE